MPILVELFCAPHCSNCRTAAERLRHWTIDGDVELQLHSIVDEIDRAVDLGIRQAPALVIDGRLMHQGPLSNQRLQQLFGEPPCPI